MKIARYLIPSLEINQTNDHRLEAEATRESLGRRGIGFQPMIQITRRADISSTGDEILGAVGADGSVAELSGDLFGNLTPTGRNASSSHWLAPLQPAAIFCTGLNYRKHAEESGASIPSHPVLFTKNVASVIGHEAEIVLPRFLRSDQVDYECELAVVIGRRCRNVRVEDALDHVLGYTCANDVSARDWQKDWGGSQWCRGKSFDTFCPLGPYIVTADELPDPGRLAIRTLLNGEIVQDSNTADMIFSVAEQIAFYSGSTTLLPGTVILTGTPSGVGMARTPPRWLAAGDEVVVEIEGIGRLANRVMEESGTGQATL